MVNKIKIYKILCIYIGLLLIAQSSIAGYSELYEPNVPNNIVIRIEKNDLKDFDNEIKELSLSDSWNMSAHKKNNYRVQIFNKSNGDKDSCDAKIRINGDWKDHINVKSGIASLDVSLVECYIGDIKNFKLFLPETRKGNNEVFWNILLDRYGFPTYYSKIVRVDFGGRKYFALFQEKPSLAFLERHGLRETAILKGDERQVWQTVTEFTSKAKEQSNRLNDKSAPMGFRVKNTRAEMWDGDTSYASIANMEFLKDAVKVKISNNALSEYRNNSKLIINDKFYNKINKKFADHGLAFINRRFVYLPYLNAFVPLYYDGNVELLNGGKCEIDPTLMPDKSFEKKFSDRTLGDRLTGEMICAYQEVAKLANESSWSFEEQFKLENPIKYSRPSIGSLDSGFKNIYMQVAYTENSIPFIYDKNTGAISNVKSEKIMKKIMAGNSSFEIDKMNVSVVAAGEMVSKIDNRGLNVAKNQNLDFIVRDGERFFVNLMDSDDRSLKIWLEGNNSKVIFTGTVGNNDRIAIYGNAKNDFETRHDDLMLTGCATFINVDFKGGSLYSTVQGCEDSINIMNSRGNINSIVIEGATQDALDIDFSNLNIVSIKVDGAGNDCIDLSTGVYNFNSVFASKCADKGVSVGERSRLSIDHVFVNIANSGIAVKDESVLVVNKVVATNIDDVCVPQYIKKSKYSNPKVDIKEISCDIH